MDLRLILLRSHASKASTNPGQLVKCASSSQESSSSQKAFHRTKDRDGLVNSFISVTQCFVLGSQTVHVFLHHPFVVHLTVYRRDYLRTHNGQIISIDVYNTRIKIVRRIQITPNDQWYVAPTCT